MGEQCSVFGCERPAVMTETRRTTAMPATGFYPVCVAHVELPSARVALEAGLAVRDLREKRGWAVYPVGYCEYDLYPGWEGPQRELSLDEAIEGIGGDQHCRLAPAGVVTWPTLDAATQARVLAGEDKALVESAARDYGEWGVRAESAAKQVQELVMDGRLSADAAKPVLVALEEWRHECAVKSL